MGSILREFTVCAPLQIEEVVIVDDKVTKARRGFVFVTFTTFEAVEECCNDQTFHTIKEPGRPEPVQVMYVYT